MRGNLAVNPEYLLAIVLLLDTCMQKSEQNGGILLWDLDKGTVDNIYVILPFTNTYLQPNWKGTIFITAHVFWVKLSQNPHPQSRTQA